ncbi:MAG: hypothetical protein HDS64_01730 [Bacteroidales bacterium]|nr:hypothetical protein [Bacteroidales bacterium]
MIKIIFRVLGAVIIAAALSSLGIIGNSNVLQTLFTVLGIVFSISMSLLVSFSLAKILNKSSRLKLRNSISHTRNMLLIDFGISTFSLVVALLWAQDSLIIKRSWFVLDIMLLAVVIIAVSLVYEIYNFRKLHRLHTDIEDAIIKEETAK